MADMAENRLVHHKIQHQEFEREMTMVLLELKEEFSPERVEARLTEYSATLPPPPEVSAVEEVLPRRDLERIFLYQAQLPEKSPEPLSTFREDTFPKVAVISRGRKLSTAPLVVPSRRAVTIPGAVQNPESPAPKEVKNYRVALADWRERPEDAGESIRKQLETALLVLDKTKGVAIRPVKPQKKARPLQLHVLFHVAISSGTVSLHMTEPVLPARRKVAVSRTKPWKEGEQPHICYYSRKVLLPNEVKTYSSEPLDLGKPSKTTISAIKPPKETKPLELDALAGVTVPKGAAMPYAAEPVLPVKREVPVCQVKPWKKGGTLAVRYSEEVSLPGEARQCSSKPLDLDKPGKTTIPAVKLVGETKHVELDALTNVTIPGRMAAHAVVSPVLPGKRRGGMCSPLLPVEAENVRVKLPEEFDRVPVAKISWEKKMVEPAPKIVKQRVPGLRPLNNMENPQKLRLKMPENARERFNLISWNFSAEETALYLEEPENSIALEPAPNLLEIWEKIDGPVALIADFGQVP